MCVDNFFLLWLCIWQRDIGEQMGTISTMELLGNQCALPKTRKEQLDLLNERTQKEQL